MSDRRRKSKKQRRALRSLLVESLESRRMLTTPYGALPSDTGEFFLGKVAVTPVFLESDGTVNVESQDWTPSQIAATKAKIQEGVDWWTDTLATYSSVHSLEFVVDWTHADTPVETGYEPIDGSSDSYASWVDDFLDHVSFNTTASVHDDIRAFNHAQREANGADWSFTIFVVDSDEDPDGEFASGTFSLAYAFAGGRFIVAPSTRPASTFAHEVGHMFWARDEYLGGGSYTDRRGYYNAQNTNAANNPAGTQEPSIMASGTLLTVAYNSNITSESSRQIMGWRDSDNDGVFDVLDVPHELEATGEYNPGSDTFRLQGRSVVGTLPNSNSSGNQSDLTINTIDVLEYRIDGGDWTTAMTFTDTYEANLDVTVDLNGGTSIEFRTLTRDSVTSATVTTSNVFMGGPNSPNTTALPGVSGIVFNDGNTDGLLDDGEPRIAGATVRLTDEFGVALEQTGIEPDDFDNGADISTATDGVELRASGWSIVSPVVLSRDRDTTSTGDRVFAFLLGVNTVAAEWIQGARELVINFDTPTTRVAIDAVANSDGDVGRLEIYNSKNDLIGRYTTGELNSGEFEQMELIAAGNDIAYAVVGGFADTAIRLDNLEYGAEVETQTDNAGGYRLAGVGEGTHYVQSDVGSQAVVDLQMVVSTGQPIVDVNIPAVANAWHNASMPLDVNGDGEVTVLDLRDVFVDVTINGIRTLTVEADSAVGQVDIDNDGVSSLTDLRLVFSAFVVGGGGAGGGGEGEFTGYAATTPFVSPAITSSPVWAGLSTDDADNSANNPANNPASIVYQQSQSSRGSWQPLPVSDVWNEQEDWLGNFAPLANALSQRPSPSAPTTENSTKFPSKLGTSAESEASNTPDRAPVRPWLDLLWELQDETDETRTLESPHPSRPGQENVDASKESAHQTDLSDEATRESPRF